VIKMEKIGYNGLLNTLKEQDFEPVGIHDPRKYITSISAPNFKKHHNGRITLVLPDEIFNNREDTRQFNRGKYKMFLLFAEDLRV